MKIRTSEKVFEHLKECLMNGKWKDGEQITPEILLSKELNVGRNAVREAIEKLVGLNLLIKIKGKGTFVNLKEANFEFNNLIRDTIVKKDDYMDILVFRENFETKNIEMFIDNADENLYIQLEEIYEKMILYKNESEKFSYYDAQFHNLIAKGTNNSIIIKISDILSDLMIMHQKNLNLLLGSESGIKEHKLILESLLKKDKELAMLYMKRHVLRTIKDVEQR